MLNFSASFALWHRRTYRRDLTRPERLIIEQLERQRHASGRNCVLAAISDPSRRHTLLLSTYALWFQTRFCPHLDSVAFIPETAAQVRKYHFLTQNLSGLTIRTARQKRHVFGAPLGVALMFGADLYCPSFPNWRRPRIHTFLSWVIPAMPLRNHLILIIGDATNRRTFFSCGFQGRLRRTRNPQIRCFRPIQFTLPADTYSKIDTEQKVEQVSNLRPTRNVEQASQPAKEQPSKAGFQPAPSSPPLSAPPLLALLA